MNPLTQIKNTQKATKAEVRLGLSDTASWHDKFRHSAYVFVGGIDYELTEGDLLAVFAQYGEIVDAHLVRDKKTGKSKGFAFLAYEDQRSTILAVDNLSGAKVSNRVVRVEHVDNYKRKRAEIEGTDPDAVDDEPAPTQRGAPGPSQGQQGRGNQHGGMIPEPPRFHQAAQGQQGLGIAGGMDMASDKPRKEKKEKKKKDKKEKKEKKEKKDKKRKRDDHSPDSSSTSSGEDVAAGARAGPHQAQFGPPRPAQAQTQAAQFGPPRPGPPRPAPAPHSDDRRDGGDDRGGAAWGPPRPSRRQEDEPRTDRGRDDYRGAERNGSHHTSRDREQGSRPEERPDGSYDDRRDRDRDRGDRRGAGWAGGDRSDRGGDCGRGGDDRRDRDYGRRERDDARRDYSGR